MKTAIALWLSLGALTASTALNVYLARGLEELPPPCVLWGAGCTTQSQPCCPLAETVDLTAGQRQCFAMNSPAYIAQRAQTRKELDALVAELEKALRADSPDVERIHHVADEIGKARAAELKLCIDGILLVRKTLTPEQLKRLTESCGRH